MCHLDPNICWLKMRWEFHLQRAFRHLEINWNLIIAPEFFALCFTAAAKKTGWSIQHSQSQTRNVLHVCVYVYNYIYINLYTWNGFIYLFIYTLHILSDLWNSPPLFFKYVTKSRLYCPNRHYWNDGPWKNVGIHRSHTKNMLQVVKLPGSDLM